MDTRRRKFYEIYLPLLKTALLNEDTNGLLDPEEYTDDETEKKLIENYFDNVTNDPFIVTVADYYAARNYGFRIEEDTLNWRQKEILADIDLFQKWIHAISSHEAKTQAATDKSATHLKVEEIKFTQNELHISFDETEIIEVLAKALNYIKSQNFKYYYFEFYDNFFNHDISLYYKDYPILLEKDAGCMKIKPEHIDNITFMYKIMTQYHDSYLYVNDNPDFMRFYDPTYRVQKFPDNIGYMIAADGFDYISIRKASNLPDWDLKQMGFEI